jgi:hypothetical protein
MSGDQRRIMVKLSLKATRLVLDALEHYRRHFDQELQRERLSEDEASDLENDPLYLDAIKHDLEEYRDKLAEQHDEIKAAG